MPDFDAINRKWADAIRAHATAPLIDDAGQAYRAIGKRSLNFLGDCWRSRRDPLPDLGRMIEAGKDVRFWSDAHFGHAAIIGMCGRPFADGAEMDAAIWAAVEDAASRADFLLCLGDLSMTDSLGVQRRLHALLGDRQATLSGNHDRKNCDREEWARLGGIASLAFSLPTGLLREWIEAQDANGIEWNALPERIEFGACHYPVPPSRMPGPSWISLHGHSHGQPQGPLRLDFSVEAVGYRPISLRDALKPALFHDLVLLQEECFDLAAMPAPK